MQMNFESYTQYNFLSYGLLMKQEQPTANNVPGLCLPPSPCQLQVIAVSEPFMPL